MANILKLVLIALGGLLVVSFVFSIIKNIVVWVVGILLIAVAIRYGLSLLRDE